MHFTLIRLIFIILSFVAKSVSKICFFLFLFHSWFKVNEKLFSFSFKSRLNCHKLFPRLMELVTRLIAPENWNTHRSLYFNLFWADTINRRISFHFILIGLKRVNYRWKLSRRWMNSRPSFILFTLEFIKLHFSGNDRGRQHSLYKLNVKSGIA